MQAQQLKKKTRQGCPLPRRHVSRHVIRTQGYDRHGADGRLNSALSCQPAIVSLPRKGVKGGKTACVLSRAHTTGSEEKLPRTSLLAADWVKGAFSGHRHVGSRHPNRQPRGHGRDFVSVCVLKPPGAHLCSQVRLCRCCCRPCARIHCG